AQPVFLLVGVVRVPRPEAVFDLLVVARARVGVLDQEPDRRAGRVPLEEPGEDAHLIALTALADELRGAGTPPVDILLDVLLRQGESRRTAIDDAAERRPVALAEGRHREKPADRVA